MEDNQNRDGAINSGTNIATAAASSAAKGTIKLTGKAAKIAARKAGAAAAGAAAASTPVIIAIVVIIVVILLLSILVGGTSQAVMDKTYYLTPVNEDSGWNMPDKDDWDTTLWNKDAATAQSSALMRVINEMKQDDKDKALSSISKYCKKNGYDEGLTMQHLQQSSTVANITTPVSTTKDSEDTKEGSGKKKNSKDTGKVLAEYYIGGVSDEDLSRFLYEDIIPPGGKWDSGTFQESIAKSDKLIIDEHGLCKYQNDDGTEDYLVALGRFFGPVESRYRITFKNGTVATFLKFDQKKDEDTKPEHRGIVGINGGVLEFVVATDVLMAKESMASTMGDVAYLHDKIFDKIEKIEQIDGKISSSFSMSISGGDMQVLAAYSVSIANLNFTKVGGKKKYVDEKGHKISVSWSEDREGIVDYEKDLKKKIKKYLKNNSFYEVDYEQEDGKDKVYEELILDDPTEKNTPKPTNEKKTTDDGTEEEEPSYTVAKYVVPILKEKDISLISEELFGVDPNATYVNAGTEDVTNRTAITTLAENTAALLYDANPSSSTITGVPGKVAWPAVGVYLISSKFGKRNTGIPGASTYHYGIDIAAGEGTPIVAYADGTVTVAQTNYTGYGTAVVIDHGNGLSSLYGHLSEYKVSVGQKVSKGQQIALSGHTGIGSGPHLHFGIEQNGKFVDPEGDDLFTPEIKSLLKYTQDAINRT